MLFITVLFLLTAILFISTRKLLSGNFQRKESGYESFRKEYEKMLQENVRLKSDNADLEKIAEDTIALYDITKDICKTLDEDKIFAIFKSHINKYITLNDCQFLKTGVDLKQYEDVTILPLKIQKINVGYLVAGGIKAEEKERFYILAQQFLLGVKRALLYKEVQELTITDSLTQVFSRRYFLERFNEEMVRSKNLKLSLSFLMVDIDRFKGYNDHYGHLVGDSVLREVTKVIKENIRQIDFMGRYGGEELSIILAETDKEQARFAAERIRLAIESKIIRAYDEELKVTISIGVSTFPDDADNAGILIDKADQALYLAKHTGRNKVCVYKAK